MNKILALIYGAVCYLVFFATFLYSIGFVGNLLVPKSIDSGAQSDFTNAIITNLLLLSLFAVQHTVMARPAFKNWWTRIIPFVIERSTYVLLSSVVLIVLFWLWQPMTTVIWSVDNATGRGVLWALFAAGWLIVLISTFLISHFELFGLSQVYRYLTGQEARSIGFETPSLYQYVRHPIMLGFVIAFWATPDMSLGHLIFAIMTTAYILIAIQFEENDLVKAHGESYSIYQRQVSMIVPWPFRK
ncbi:MAG: isoprenylcysteine carboxylmethyltransferase family protein [Gammaproteobacteria bacterium]|nr:isoprenylcysteine carboxylmethyltransferase family protein [Gammaproteobacteria bacterium]MDH5591781.1 isoprenylcysteine carboxylmethyltransferase family protein [Gammaproteobacteria bacterium]